MKKYLALFTIIIIALFSGCATKPAAPFPAGLMGMIYDDFNNPVDGARIYLDTLRIHSDLDGRFLLPALNQQPYTITIEKEGFESEEISFDFQDPKLVLYVKMTSLDFLKTQLEKNLEEREWKTAGIHLNRALAIDETDPVLNYLAALYFYQIREWEQALDHLNLIADMDYDGEAVEGLMNLVREEMQENG